MVLEVAAVLALNALLLLVSAGALWALLVRIGDVTVVDSFWALGMVEIAVLSAFTGDAPLERKLLLTGLCAAWGLRLGWHLYRRWRTHGPDRRYRTMFGRAEAEKGWGFAQSAWRLVFLPQIPLLFVVCLPVQLGQIPAGPAGLGPLAWAGAALALVGIAFETIADAQLARFRRDPDNRERVLDTGLWRYTRHPNYFGDVCVWWGLFLIAAETPFGWASVVGPLVLTVLLTRWSGVPTTEGRMRRRKPGYEAYVARTPAFVPWFPKRAAG